MAKSEDVRAAEALADQIGKILAGKNPELQGAALALCTAIWAAGHVAVDGPDATRQMRGKLLSFARKIAAAADESLKRAPC